MKREEKKMRNLIISNYINVCTAEKNGNKSKSQWKKHFSSICHIIWSWKSDALTTQLCINRCYQSSQNDRALIDSCFTSIKGIISVRPFSSSWHSSFPCESKRKRNRRERKQKEKSKWWFELPEIINQFATKTKRGKIK